MIQLPKIYAITDREISGLSHSDQIRALAAGGIRLIQLREKMLAPGQWFEDAREARRVAGLNEAMLIVNDRVDLAMAIDADGVHLGQTDIPVDVARRLLGPKKLIGISTHTVEQIQVAILQPVDYIAFGPIFATKTKSDPDKETGLDLLHEVRSMVGQIPLVAIGGITHSNAHDVIVAGADSVAVISCLLGNADSITESSLELARTVEQQS